MNTTDIKSLALAAIETRKKNGEKPWLDYDYMSDPEQGFWLSDINFIVAATPERILELTARIEALEEALKPFTALEANCNDGLPLSHASETALACGINLRVSDLRRAARAYSGTSDIEKPAIKRGSC